MRCPSCMAANTETRRFCAQCGSAPAVPCPACGVENEAIARFCGGCGKLIGETVAPAPQAATTPQRTDSAQCHQRTVMLCDLVGSTPVAARLDTDDLREVIVAYHREVAEVVAGFDGFVAKYMADGVLVHIGDPEAHKDDFERAVRAGLAVMDATAGLDAPERFEAQVGVASGLVVGDLIGAGAAQQDSVVSSAPAKPAALDAATAR
jgi:class 3 adenylate cyclase